ncbi:16S rRNA (guanine(966)-N(2))-methyltransferase RsmD [Desulfonatronospira sp. MSAO_Bac3]|uniref:16S rRNA (guanine(966)-N(2))-methyltransferase RsmD n=1 Tax=Desulfonatronospira sp. MSAO_Bac3 TaxID=2293857 RepID=UPI000FF254AE|nr:16S rRNA (guanine(966)-N(2))-methyltransferase RsmD [Desulfonatronospira sp. MSAO_Bac3]RQD74247.1 MAG: 16S rRNA (guanine(966)-N(2))-methyltransferase RsmD [Desulfonatronospira sp. MSAO_Bac3]
MRIISGTLKGRVLKTGSGPGYRPATGKVREAIFSMLHGQIEDWSRVQVLDLFAGSGAVGLEALSRGACTAVFVENDARAVKILQENLQRLQIAVNRAKLIKKDAESFLARKAEHGFELVFVDPPYGRNLLNQVLPGIISQGWLLPRGVLCAEVESRLQVTPETYPGLDLIKDKHYGQTRILMWQKTS